MLLSNLSVSRGWIQMGIFEGPTEKIWKVARDPTLGIPEQHKECKFYSKSSDTPSRGAK